MSEAKDRSGSRRNRQQRMQSLVREDVMAAVVDLATSEGVNNLTMDQIARRADVAKGTLYLHFDNKDRLIRETIDSVIDPLVTDVLEILDGDLAPAEKLRRVAERNFTYFDHQRKFFRLFLFERYLAQTEAQRQTQSHFRQVLGGLERVIAEGTASGAFRSLEPGAIALAWMDTVTALVVRRLMDDDPGPVDAEVELVLELFLHGLSAS